MATMQRIQINPEKCTGCRICELICAFTKHTEFNPKRSRIRIVKLDKFFADVPVVCKQCHDPSCEASCPVGAVTQDPHTIVHVDEKTCNGCELCVEACPFGGIFIDPLTNAAIVCDLCGGVPQCVKWCPTGALEFRPADSSSQRERRDAVVPTVQSLLSQWGIPWEECEQYYGKRRSREP